MPNSASAFFTCLICLEIQFKMWEYPHLTCFAENRTDMTKTGGKNQASVDQRTSGIQALCKAVCQSISFHEAFEWHCNPWITHQRPKTPLQLLTIEHLWGFEQELQLPINRDPQRKTLTPWKLPVWLQDPSIMPELRSLKRGAAASPVQSVQQIPIFFLRKFTVLNPEMNAICREKSAICSESVRSVESKKNGDFIFFVTPFCFSRISIAPLINFGWLHQEIPCGMPRIHMSLVSSKQMRNTENAHVPCVKQIYVKCREFICLLHHANRCEMTRIHMPFACLKDATYRTSFFWLIFIYVQISIYI